MYGNTHAQTISQASVHVTLTENLRLAQCRMHLSGKGPLEKDMHIKMGKKGKVSS